MTNRLSFTEFSAAVSGGTLVLSVLYEWAYFKVAGFELLGLMTISDLFRLALVWLPATFLVLLGLVMYELLTQGIEKGMSEEEIIATSSHPKFFGAFRKSAPIALMLVVGVTASLNALFSNDPSFSAIGVCLVIFWGILSNKITSVQRIRETYGAIGCLMIVLAPIVVIMCVSYGAGKAKSDIAEKANDYDVELVEGSSLLGINILRSLERGIIIKNESENSLIFLPWSEVSSVHASIQQSAEKKSYACRIVSKFCVDSGDQD